MSANLLRRHAPKEIAGAKRRHHVLLPVRVIRNQIIHTHAMLLQEKAVVLTLDILRGCPMSAPPCMRNPQGEPPSRITSLVLISSRISAQISPDTYPSPPRQQQLLFPSTSADEIETASPLFRVPQLNLEHDSPLPWPHGLRRYSHSRLDQGRSQPIIPGGVGGPITQLPVESHFCANCLENIPLAEARMKKNRCATCFDCPSCTHTMSTRAVSLSTPNPDDPKKVTTHKVYYLVCGFCRWTSRDIGLPDQTVATGGWPERENPNTQRINQLLEYYKVLATIERQKKDRKKFVPRRSYLHYNDKFGLTAMVARKRAGLPPLGGLAYKDDGGNAPEVLASIATEEVEQLPEDIFTKPIDISKVTTLPQRLSQPDFQPLLTQGLLPVHKQFLIKRSQRCRVCEHNVSKPEYNPSSTKFKIQLFA
uniref:Dynactin subunit 4 n=1 Tax=Timema monikensis TaxID=170555 RepID=A0A7R9E158_9NEOP|nr:unnamed protein product [Timema monikensis]